MAIHIHLTADLAERVLLPGDPGRALRLAQELIDGPKMLNHNRGLWGYSGPAKLDGTPLSIQSTGMGGPSAAIVVHELIELGARRLLRVGTCGGLDPALTLGDLLVATEVIADDGSSRALGAEGAIAPSGALTRALLDTLPAPHDGPVVSTDLFYGAEHREAGWRAAGARAVEMEAAALCALARRHDVEAAVMLIVSDRLAGPGAHERIDEAGLLEAERRLGEAAVGALAQSLQQTQPT